VPSVALKKVPVPKIGTIVHAIGVIVIVLFVLAPVYVVLLVSLSPPGDILSGAPHWIPHFTFSSYSAILRDWRALYSNPPQSSVADQVIPGIRNSFIVAVPVAVLNILIAASAGYGFARVRFPGRHILSVGLLATQMVPSLILIVPVFILFQRVDLTDSLLGVIIADLSITVPFTVWIVANAIDAVPVELERAARVDGASWLGSMLRITLPLARGGLLTAGLIAFLFSWNDLVYPLILVSNPNAIQIQPAVAGMYTDLTANFGVMTAATVIATVPALIIATLAMRPLISGLLAGAVKG
jgi:multiple sugar transport system permease protein